MANGSIKWTEFRTVVSPVNSGTKLAFIKKFIYLSIPPLEHPMLSAGDPQRPSIAPVGTPWRVGDKGGEPHFSHHGY